MANSPVEILYTALKSQYEPPAVRYPYSFDEKSVPYLYMYEASDPRTKTFLCDGKGGEARFTVGYVSDDFADCVDTLETMLDWIEANILGDYSPLAVHWVDLGGVRDLTGIEQADKKIYRREADVIITWGKA